MIDQKQRTARHGTLENYVATFDETEHRELAVAALALVVAEALDRARHATAAPPSAKPRP